MMTSVSSPREQSPTTLGEALRAEVALRLGKSDEDRRVEQITDVLLNLGEGAGELTAADAHVTANRAAAKIRKIVHS